MLVEIPHPLMVELGVASSTFLFAVGHLNFLGGLAGFFSRDTLVLFLLQLATGGSIALLYVLTGHLFFSDLRERSPHRIRIFGGRGYRQSSMPNRVSDFILRP